MLVYKWVINKNKKYFPLVNFGIIPPIKNIHCGCYEIGKIYNQYQNILEKSLGVRANHYKNSFHIAGFHFWKEPKNKYKLEQYNHCLKHYKKIQINSILKCKINKEDIIIEDNKRIVTKKFKVLEEIKC